MKNPVYSVESIFRWIADITVNTEVKISKIPLEECRDWFYDENCGKIHNKENTFFYIGGISGTYNGQELNQPIIYQNEIGYLGLLCAKIDGVICFLMQAKIEPGNINCIQISPTIQATKSNFTQRHGGAKPEYLDYFLNASADEIIVDQIESEQSSRFMGKRNRNIIVWINDPQRIEIGKNHMWISIHQLKELMKYDNIVNMDTRTVLSCIPYSFMPENHWCERFRNLPIRNSVFKLPDIKTVVEVYRYINDYRMFSDNDIKQVPLYSLNGWSTVGNEFVNDLEYAFKMIFCDISIEGREVKNWCQPLFEATGKALFGLIYKVEDEIVKFLVHIHPEVGCFDGAEVGPTVQREAICPDKPDEIVQFFYNKMKKKENVEFDTMLSEEGGRFYHEENRNVIIKIGKDELTGVFPGYIWSDYATLNMLVQVNNCLNIQLRNLLSVFNMLGRSDGSY